jgi:hypothetical protein
MLLWLLGVRRSGILDEGGKLGGLSVLLFFSQAHFRHSIFKDGNDLRGRAFS